ncbi:MAG: hypothetical protein OK439_02485 [Thaumarchaeota archaeon]|nr:hypothetical protein [Nitrososphaerota archaeon]
MAKIDGQKHVERIPRELERIWFTVFSFGSSLLILSIVYFAIQSLSGGRLVVGILFSSTAIILAMVLAILIFNYRKRNRKSGHPFSAFISRLEDIEAVNQI